MVLLNRAAASVDCDVTSSRGFSGKKTTVLSVLLILVHLFFTSVTLSNLALEWCIVGTLLPPEGSGFDTTKFQDGIKPHPRLELCPECASFEFLFFTLLKTFFYLFLSKGF